MGINWDEHRKHRQQVIETHGRWVGLCDENCEPLMDFPPVVSMTAPESRLNLEDFEAVTTTRTSSGEIHPIVDELIASPKAVGMQQVDTGPSRWVVVETEGKRLAYKVVNPTLTLYDQEPVTLHIRASDALSRLQFFPGMSWPGTWKPVWRTFTRDWVGPERAAVMFKQPRELADMKMATAADGWVLSGPAEATIRKFITECLNAAFRIAQVPSSDRYIQVDPNASGVKSPDLLMRPQDGTLWEEIEQVCLMSGVVVSTSLWWPGDTPVRGLSLSKPTLVVKVEQKGHTL